MTTNNQDTPMVYTYYINDPDSEVGVYGRVASSQEEVEADLHDKGFTDFFLFEVRDLVDEEKPESADLRIKLSPHLGPQWLPVVDALELVTSSPKAEFLQLQTFARKYNFSSASPYIQGQIISDGTFHIEAPKHIFESGVLDQKKRDQMLFIGWNPPGDDDATYNFWRIFEVGWNPRSVAEFALETLTTVFSVTEEDFFDFGSGWKGEAILARCQLERVTIHKDNPNGYIFRIPSDKFPVDPGLD